MGEEGSGGHGYACVSVLAVDREGLERGPNKDMSVVVCIQPAASERTTVRTSSGDMDMGHVTTTIKGSGRN